MSITAFPVLARILKESGLIYTTAGTGKYIRYIIRKQNERLIIMIFVTPQVQWQWVLQL
jgi:hypothetical protein